MKIVLLSSPWTNYPPSKYGGIEMIVTHLINGLIHKGHEVILSAINNHHLSCPSIALYDNPIGEDAYARKDFALYLLNHIYYTLKHLPKNIDIIHNNCETYALHLLNSYNFNFVSTLHGAYYHELYKDRNEKEDIISSMMDTLHLFKKNNFISISNSQRTQISDLNYLSTIYNCLDISKYPFNSEPATDHIVWLSKFAPYKGLETTIQVAKTVYKKLSFYTFIRKGRDDDFAKNITPFINNTTVVYKGHTTSDLEKSIFFSNGKLFLFPINWEEPFGLVMIESMATGTPVIAYARGSVPEIIKDGETGFIVNQSDIDIRGNWIIKKTGIEGLCEAVEKIYAMSKTQYVAMRKACREHVEKHFTVEQMVDQYEKVYKEILEKQI